MTSPTSPCISLCKLDERQVCLGCGRTLVQIAEWSLLSQAEQIRITEQLARPSHGSQPPD